ncbi:hypothetical protein SLS64_007496 [Diaporthe eres]|uniref:Cyanovirin-N domain-containing protein n=1 Tax=Diaporthe eres TaxID=83184 RepID=A0ABR1NRK9_DIAER
MQFPTLKLVVLTVLGSASSVGAICPGFNAGIGHQQNLGGGVSRWTIYDTNCRAIDSLTTTGNPCDSGMFGCSPPPIIFNRWRYNANGLWFSCRTDSRAGSCGSDSISVCCRNDGGRLALFESEEVGLDLTVEEFSEEELSEEAA